jgi:hypothetical protein
MSTAIGTAYASATTDTHDTEQNVQGGQAAAQDSSTSLSLSSSAGGVTVVQDSPQSLAAISQASTSALSAAGNVASASLALSSRIAGNAQETLSGLAQTPASQLQKFAMPLLLVGALVAVVYFYKRG